MKSMDDPKKRFALKEKNIIFPTLEEDFKSWDTFQE